MKESRTALGVAWMRAAHQMLDSKPLILDDEPRLADSISRGVRQFVVLGAGYDTFFARQPEWARSP